MKKTLLIIAISTSILLGFGIIGYSYFEGWSVADSFYMTVITITTTGYQEVHPLSYEGRMFTVVLLCAGVLTLAFLTHILINDIMSIDREEFRRQKMKKKINSLSGHTIVCGFGRMGQNICRELENFGVSFVVLDKSPENFKEAPPHYLWLSGDATSDKLLIEAGIEKASILASMVNSDADSLYLTLAARSLNPKLKIYSRASSDSVKLKLLRAGANKVVQPLLLSSQKVAKMVVGQDDDSGNEEGVATMCAEKREVSEFPDWVGQSAADVEAIVNQRILAVVNESGEVLVRGELKRVLNDKDTILFAGVDRPQVPHLRLVKKAS